MKLPKRLGLKERFLRTRPQVKGDLFYLTYRAEWLATLLVSEVAETKIRERAIEKAEKRSKELRIMKPGMELWKERGQRYAEISARLPRRPVYLGGARLHMKRQGQGVPKGPRDLLVHRYGMKGSGALLCRGMTLPRGDASMVRGWPKLQQDENGPGSPV